MRGQNSNAMLPVLRGFGRLVSAFALVALAACAAQQPTSSAAATPPTQGSGEFRVVLDTDQGALAVVFDPATAPLAVAALRSSFERQDWTGVPIQWVRPHTEIRTGLPRDATPLASELSADPLALGEKRIEDAGAAMNSIQFELEPAFGRAGSEATPELQAWIATWRQHFDPAFLIGVTRQQINEALGYRYRQGYATQPVRRGSVALVASKPGSSTLALAILLRDQPKRDGCWVVVGRVESGMERVDTLSIAPRLHPKSFEPERPARITRTEITELLSH
ncbi:MAG TPA: peptidylprolyl isomerase [Xanthomonadales bacterium]|nr:peptidylprolyl isomerase [Xanthomonadales bacterium]